MTSELGDASRTTMSDIKSVAWAACNSFRGVIDPSEYKDYILIMLFVKFVSDVWRQHEDDYRRELKGDDVRVKRRMQRERFVMPEGATFIPKTATFLHIFQANTSASVDRRGGLRWDDFAKIRVPLPAVAEQKSISQFIDTGRREITLLDNTAMPSPARNAA